MYYLLKGHVKDEDGYFEWVVEANSIEDAKAKLEKNDILDEIREISVEERIEREKKDLLDSIQYDYLIRRFGNCTIREFGKNQREMKTNPEMYYKALVEFNKANRLIKRLYRRGGFNKITMAQFFEIINKLIDAQTEEEFNTILQNVDR